MNALITGSQRESFAAIIEIARQIHRNKAQRLFFNMFPEEDDPDVVLPGGTIAYSRHKYPKHMEFFRVGDQYRERCFLAANRVGKSVTGGYELTAHLTGLYPEWWEGKRFERPIRAWAAGKNNETTRDTLQEMLVGEVSYSGTRKGVSGTGLVPGNLLGQLNFKQNGNDLLDFIKVKHKAGGWSRLGFKSYERGRGSFEGTAQHVILLDEECPSDIYGECLTRTATTNGVVMLTFTPLEGLTETVQQFMPEDMRPGAD